MRKLALIAISTASLALASSAAYAQETTDWTGFYAGIFGGYAGGTADFTILPPVGVVAAPISTAGDIGGLFGGIALGANYQLQQGLVIGVEADIGVADIFGKADLGALFGPGVVIPVTSEISALASVRGRVGYALDRFLPFATAGLALGRARQNVNYIIGSFDPVNENLLGWTVGAGVEYAATEAISVKAEYRYSHFAGKEVPFPLAPTATSKSSFGTHDIRLGVNYRF